MKDKQRVKQAKEEGIQRFVVGAIISHNKTVLILQRPKDDFMGGMYELPSGKVEGDESLSEALHREIQEETGLEVSEITSHLGSFDYTSGSGTKTRQFTYNVQVTATQPIQLTEHDAYAWVSEKELEKYGCSDSVQQLLKAFWNTQ